MFQTAITLQEWADIFDGLTTFRQVDVGPILTTTGTHPVLGVLVAVQDHTSMMILHSQAPARVALAIGSGLHHAAVSTS